MNQVPKPNRDAPHVEGSKTLELFEAFATLYKDEVECLAEIQNRTIDCALQHNKATTDLWKQMLEKVPGMPRVNMPESLSTTLDRLAEMQKVAVKLGVDQTRLLVDVVKERTTSAGKTGEAMSKLVKQGFEQSIAANKKFAEATLEESKAAFQNVRERYPVPGSEAIADNIQQGVDAIINAQKDLLETVSHHWTPARQTVPTA